jgi:glycosyltransferase involved in cell wall biosynthesis
MMRIAYLCADGGIPVFGDKGGSVHVRAMVRAFARIGHDVTVLCAEAGEGAQDFPVTALGPEFPPAEARADKERRLIALAGAMEERLCALHARRPFDMIYERYGLWSAAGIRAARRLGIPVVIEVNAPLVQEQAAFRNFALRDDAEAIEAEVFSGASVLAVVSQELAGYVVARGAEPARVHVIGNAVDTSVFHPSVPPAPMPEVPPGRFVVGFTGSLKAWHGTGLLLEALASLRPTLDAHLLIVGDGPDRPALEERAQMMGLADRVTVTGWVPHALLPALIARMDVAVAPYPASANHYFSPLKLFEYLAMGRPIVASALGQTASLLGPDGAGLLVPPGDAAALTEALTWIARDPRLAAELSQRAARLGRRFDWTANADRITTILGQRAAA